MRSHPAWALVAATLMAAPAARAEEPDPGTSIEEEARAGIERLMRALELFLQSIPQFEAPYVNDDGDIIIPRKHPAPDEPPAGDLPGTST